ncbi:MAG: D-2-hydroxyacid dehydrogenase [Acidobacteria bacterium]|nr:D-2-hydroxyacid dehydrogenase [Acidobacteriota bacterium]
MAPVKVVTSIASEPVWTFPPIELERLARRFPGVRFADAPLPADRAREFADADVLFLSRLSPPELAAAPRVRWIQSPAAGVGGLLFPELRVRPIVVTNARGVHGQPIAEHVIGLVVVLFRQLHRAVRRQARHEWAKDELSAFRPLSGATLGVIGLGAIGQAVAALAASVGMRVVAVRRRAGAQAPPGVARVYPTSELRRFLGECDVVVVAAPLTAETRGLIGRDELRAMRRDGVLVNVSRGKLLREAEVAEELASGTIAGAALDVFEHEPLDPGSPLWDLPNVVITPHTSAFRRDYWQVTVDLFADNLERFLRGEPLVNVVDKEAGY